MDFTCSVTGTPFQISQKEQELVEGMGFPLMPICHEERMRNLMATRNEWKLYHRTCDKTGDKILSAYPDDSPYTVYRNDIWWGDSWEALDYGRDFDFNRPFFEQFFDLQKVVPREGTSVFESQNCDYNSHTRYSKDSYLNSLVVRGENLMYSYWMVDVEDVVDCCCHISGKSSLTYECVDYGTCYNSICLQECHNCSDSAFCYQLRGCDHCLFCSNLSNKSYHIRNEPCTEEEFEKAWKQYICGSYEAFEKGRREWIAMRSKAIHRNAYLLNCENVTGDHIFDSRNCSHCFDGDASEDCSYSISLNDSKDIHSCYSAGWPRCEQVYHCAVSRGSIDMAFCRYMFFCNDMRYCDSCQTCKHCFGCIGLRHKDYCILNKQYSKVEYEELVPRIIDHMKKTPYVESGPGTGPGPENTSDSNPDPNPAMEWGQMYPKDTMPFAYNETAAQDYMPLERDDALKRGFLWRDQEEEKPNVSKIIPVAQLPNNLSDVPDDVLHWAIECEITDKPFRIIKQELEFYRQMNLPLPRIHPTERHKRRMGLRNPLKLWESSCQKCGKGMETSFDPQRGESVVCEECYLEEIY